MPLATADTIERWLGLPAADAARVQTFVPLASRYLRELKGQRWYDAMLSVLPAPIEPDPADDPGLNLPEIEVSAPIAGATYASPVPVRVRVSDDHAVATAHYAWQPEGTGTEGLPPSTRYVLPIDLPKKVAHVAFLLGLPEGAGTLWFLLVDTNGNLLNHGVEITVEGSGVEQGVFEYADALPTQEERAAADHAESLLALYFGLPQLNLRLDPEGGVLTTVWTSDENTGARTQTQFAGAERLDALRADLLYQAKLLVGGSVRIEESGTAASTRIDGVEGFAGGAGYFGYI